MKKTGFILICIFLTISTFSQDNKKTPTIGGNLYINREITKSDNYESRRLFLYIAPNLEYTIIKGLSVGSQLNLNFRRTKSTSYNNEAYWVSDKGLSPFIKYYFTFKNSNIYPSIRYGLILQGDYFLTSAGSDQWQLHQKPAIGIGYMYMFKDLGLYIELNKQWTSPTYREDNSFKDDRTSIEFGVKYKLHK